MGHMIRATGKQSDRCPSTVCLSITTHAMTSERKGSWLMCILCDRDALVKKVGANGLIVEVAPGVEGTVQQTDVDVTTNPDLRSWQAGDTMDVKVTEVGVQGLISH